MKKLFLSLVAILFANVLLAQVGQTFWIGDLSYKITSTNPPQVTTVGVANTTITTANIPATVTYQGTTYSVTSIGNYAFNSCSSLTDVTIPNSVTSIGGYAFNSCSSLTDVTIPNSVTSIGDWAFNHCSSLTAVTIPNSVTSIENHAFYYCSSLTAVTIPNSVTSIESSAFSECSNLTSVYIPNSVTYIGDYAFYKCSRLTSITCLADNAPSLGDNVFLNTSPEILTIPFNASSYGTNWGGISWQKIYHKIGEGEVKTLSSVFEITVSKGIINEGVLRIAQGGELINETSVNVGGIIEVETPVLAAGAWHFVAAPFNGYKLAVVKPGTTDISVLEFDYSIGTWSNDWARITDEVGAGEGFFAWSFTSEPTIFTSKPNPNEDDATYTLNNSDVTVTKTLMNDAVEGNWMALANPYPFKLDVAKFLNDNSSAGIQGGIIYKYNGESFEVKCLGEINVTEGFFVNFETEGEKTANFKKTQHVSSAKAGNEREFVRLEMLDGERNVELLFAHNENAEQGYDIFDANKLFSPIAIAEPYFVTEGIALVKEEVKELPYYATMNVKSNESKEVIFRADYIPEGLAVSIIDGEEVIDLTEGAEYATEISSGENADRFKVLVKKNVGLADVEELDVRIVNNNRHIAIFTQEDVKVEVYNTLGQRVFETSETSFVLNDVATGTYVVKVYNNQGSKTQKIVVR